MSENESDEATLYDLLWLCRLEMRDLSRRTGEERTSLLSSVLSRLDTLCDDVSAAYLDKSGSKKDLHGPPGAAALSLYYRAYAISNYVTGNRLRAVMIAGAGYFRFLEVLDGYEALDKGDEAEIERLRAELSRISGQSDQTEVEVQGATSATRQPPPNIAQLLDRRSRALREFQAEKDARVAEEKFTSEFQKRRGPALGFSGPAGDVASTSTCPLPAYDSLGDDMQEALYTMYDALLTHARFSALKEIGYLLQEQEVLLFAKNNPEEAERVRREYQELARPGAAARALGTAPGKIDMVSLDSETVKGMGELLVKGGEGGLGQLQRAADAARAEKARRDIKDTAQAPAKPHQGGRTVPMDALALIEAGHPDKAIADLPGPTDARALSAEQWKAMDLVYGGGNPYTGQLASDPSGDHRDMEFRVVKTESFQPGQEESEKDEDKEASDFSDEEALAKAREWDDWKDEHKRGSGNRHNRM